MLDNGGAAGAATSNRVILSLAPQALLRLHAVLFVIEEPAGLAYAQAHAPFGRGDYSASAQRLTRGAGEHRSYTAPALGLVKKIGVLAPLRPLIAI